MISECMNPACRRELLYLRDGRVVRVVRSYQEQTEVEHYWLCGDCYLEFDFLFSGEDHVSMARRRKPPMASGRPFRFTLVA